MIDFFIGFIIGLLAYRFILEVDDHLRAKRIEEATEEVIQRFRKHVIPCKIEKVDDRFFMYNRETEEFVAHGTSYEELQENAKAKFPDKMFDVTQEELALFDK